MARGRSDLDMSGAILFVVDGLEPLFELPTIAPGEELDMNEAAAKLRGLERAVMWRKRWLALQDHLALALLATGLMAAALVVLSRLRIARLHWSLEIVMLVTVAAVLAWRWHHHRATDKEAAFLIDQAFALEDRV